MNKTIKLNINNIAKETSPNRSDGIFLFEIDHINENDNSYIFEECTIVLCTQGEGFIYVNEREYKLSPNCIVFIPPNYLARRSQSDKNFQSYMIFFSLDMITEFISKKNNHELGELMRSRSCIEISNNNMRELLEYYNFLKIEYDKPESNFKKSLMQILLLAFLMKVTEAYSTLDKELYNVKLSRGAELTEAFFKLVREHYKSERKLSFYANEMCISRKYLSSIIKQTTGKSALS